MIMSARALLALHAFNSGDRKETRRYLTGVYHMSDGCLYATDGFRVARMRAAEDDVPRVPFRLSDDLFDRLKAKDEVTIDETGCSVGKWRIAHEDPLDEIDFPKLFDCDDGDELPERGLCLEPGFLRDACDLASAVGGDIYVDELRKRLRATARGESLSVEMAIVAKVE